MTDDDIQHCNSCGKAETAEQSLLQCQGCRIVRYCSKACQKDAWKTHKKFCKLVGLYPKVSTSIRLDPDKVADFDSVLNYAAVHMTNLRHVQLVIPQTLFGPTVKLSAEALESFLTRQQQLVAFHLFTDSCHEYAYSATNRGKALNPLSEHTRLQRLSLEDVAVGSVADLSNSWNINSLSVLELNSILIGSTERRPWTQSTCTDLARAISRLKGLVKLHLRDCYFSDAAVEVLFSGEEGLPLLRNLMLNGRFGDQGACNLTDRAFEVIAASCPNLQALSLCFHQRATTAGVTAVLQSCPHLRLLTVRMARIPSEDLPDLLQLSEKLIMFQWRPAGGRQAMDESHLRAAILATGGRTILLSDFGDVMTVPDVPDSCTQAAARSQQLLDETREKLADPLVLNELEHLFERPENRFAFCQVEDGDTNAS